MKLEERTISTITGTILVHNINYASGRKAISKGIVLTKKHVAVLGELGYKKVMVAIFDDDDIQEDEAALQIAKALQTKFVVLKKGVGGRVDFETTVDGLLEIHAQRLLTLNMLPGITLATRPHYSLVGPKQKNVQLASLKIIPYAIKGDVLKEALNLAKAEGGIINVRAIPKHKRVNLLLIGNKGVQPQLQADFVPPISARLEPLEATLDKIEAVTIDQKTISKTVKQLMVNTDLLLIAGQTSIMDEDDIIPTALKGVGAKDVVHGAPVEPGNLLTLAYLPQVAVLCLPGCARSLEANVIDLVLPRLLLGDRLTKVDIAGWGLGGLLKGRS